MVLKTKSCNLLTVPNRSSPRVAIAVDLQRKGLVMGSGACDQVVSLRSAGEVEAGVGWSRGARGSLVSKGRHRSCTREGRPAVGWWEAEAGLSKGVEGGPRHLFG
jgi:hypothetical protein